jgi:two-component system sensor histidine kinase ChvG
MLSAPARTSPSHEAHKGTIRAHNRKDRSGAVFTVTLPRARK